MKLTGLAQPPPTPGLASWAFNSLFNRQTPSSKYANLLKQPQRANNTSITPRRIPKRFNDDTLLSMSNRKNVAWGGEDFKLRSRSSSFSERPIQQRRYVDDNGSIHYKDSKYFKDNELLPDDIDETDYKTKNYRYDPTPIKRNSSARINTTQDYLNNEKYGKSSLPQTYPGKYPSPYVPKNSSFDDLLLSSSAVKNLAKAKSNTRINQSMREEQEEDDPTIPIRRRTLHPLREPLKENIKSYKEKETSRGKSNREIRLDEQLLLDSIDQNIMELDNITKHVNGLKLNNKNDNELERKYKEIRQELITELKKSKKLYDSYYEFVEKYKDLKKKYKESSTEDVDSLLMIKNLKKEINFYKEENELLNHKLKSKEAKYLETDTTIHDLKSTLQNSSNFEATLRRKIKYLEDKIEQKDEDFRNERFQLNEKIFMLETTAKDDEERYKSDLRKAEERIKQLERKLELKSTIAKYENLSVIPEYRNNGYNEVKYEENDDTINLLERRYPDRRPSYAKPTSEKRYSTGNLPNLTRKRPTSLSPDFQRDNQELFKNFDESTAYVNNENYAPRSTTRSNSLRSNNGRYYNFKDTNNNHNNNKENHHKRYSNPLLPDLTFNSSEIG